MIAIALALLMQAYHPTTTRGWDGLVPQAADRTLAETSDGRAFVVEGLDASLGGYTPSARLLAQDQNRIEYVSVTFHSVWMADEAGVRRPVWFARLRHAKGAAVSERFADSRACPMVLDLLNLAEQLERPQLDFVGIPQGAPLRTDEETNMILDDVSYTLAAVGQFPTSQTRADYSVSGDSMTPVGSWGRLAIASLAPCWTISPPGGFVAGD